MACRGAIDNLKAAQKAGQFSAVVRSLEFLAKLHGHLVERRDVRVIRSVQDLSEDELIALSGMTSEEAERWRTKH